MSKRAVGVGVGILGIAALLLGLQSRQWVVGSDYGTEMHVGLRAMDQCQVVRPEADEPGEEVCSTLSHADFAQSGANDDGFDTFSLVSHLTFYAGLVTVGALLVVILLALLGRFPTTPIAPPTLAIMVSVVTLLLIVAIISIHPWREIGWGTGHAIFLAGGGATGCLAAAIVLGRLRPPVQDMW